MASGAVFVPPTTSTNGMMCGGLKGCPTRIRSGCLDFDCITLGVIPDELDAMIESTGAASSMYLRKLASAFGPGSVVMTSNPRARYSAAQLAPMTPAPTIAMRRIGLLYDMLIFLCVDFCVSDAGEISLRD